MCQYDGCDMVLICCQGVIPYMLLTLRCGHNLYCYLHVEYSSYPYMWLMLPSSQLSIMLVVARNAILF